MTTYQLRTPARLNARAWGVAMGLLCGLGLFLATNILLLKGGPVIGPRLALLGVYLPGYKVTFGGSLIGLGYGLVLGFVAGWLMGWVYNSVARQQ
jgi:hypothetical protein